MDKYCELCYARDAKPCMECSVCNPGHRNFRPAPTPPPTNADRIRAMSDEELAKWMRDWMECDNDGYMCTAKRYKNSKRCDGHCVENHLNWLRQPAEDVHDGQTI